MRHWTGTESRALRVALRLSQAEFAAKLGANERTVKRWEAGSTPRPVWQAALDTTLAREPDSVVEAFRARLCPATEEGQEMDRRQLLKAGTLGAGGLATLGVGDAAERARWLMSGAGRPDAAAVAVIRNTLYSAMQLDDMLGSPAAQGLVIAQQQLVEAMLRDCPTGLRPDVLSLYSEWTGFAGCLAWDASEFQTASRLYTLARETAHEAEDPDLGAYMLCHLSQLALWQRRPRVAVDYAVAARAWVAQSTDRPLRAYVAIRAAEAAAMAGQRQACLTALDEADRDIDGLEPCHPSASRAYFVGGALLESYRGNCLTILREAAPAAEATRRALTLIPSNYTRDRAMSLLELERALIQLDDIDEAANVVGDAADLTAQNRSPRLICAIRDGRRDLSPWAGSRPVRDLDERLAARDIVTI
ncbi:helix-turn-helix domain-containing protein [Nocardia sp. NPDC050412]|uniref:helix-turn-helix domain-containing protein n=1 Tax=Nocardia sp. NPDC050412 TaxID=3364320 RepID=UPI0037B0A5CE